MGVGETVVLWIDAFCILSFLNFRLNKWIHSNVATMEKYFKLHAVMGQLLLYRQLKGQPLEAEIVEILLLRNLHQSE